MSSSSSSRGTCRQISLDAIKVATDNFAERNVLGKGGEGKVYLANIKLGWTLTHVAVKHLLPNSTEFDKEIQTMSNIQHKNVVSLLGYCDDSGQKILIYEYMEKGSLSSYVRKSRSAILPWVQRLRICLDAARGIQHLHVPTKQYPKGIIHRDIKPDNILLGKDWVAKISDFGIFKVSVEGQVESVMKTNLKGTSGYFAPEYNRFLQVTRKIDVYAFGVVLFQVLCLKMPWDRGDKTYIMSEDEDLGIWAEQNVDPEIGADICDESLKAYAAIIGYSLKEDPTKRPTMDDVVSQLEKAIKFQEIQEEEKAKKARATIESDEHATTAGSRRGPTRRPTTLHDRGRDGDDDDYQDKDYDVTALANNPSQAFRYGIYGNDDNDEAHGSLERDDEAEAKILRGPHEDLESYLQVIDQLRSNINFFSNNKIFKSSDGVLNHSNNLLAKAISMLEDEFKQLLSSHSKPVEPDRLFECLPNSLRPSSELPGEHGESAKNHHNGSSENAVYTPPTLIPPRILPLLHNLAQQMVQAGHQQQLLIIYRDTRSPVLEESLWKLGVEKLSKDDVQKMQWEVLEAKIENWIHFMRIAFKLLFAGERKVCDKMFEGIDSLRDQCFAEVTAGSVAVLLSFGDAIAKSKRSPEKLFVLLDMYKIMREFHSEIDTLFIGKACNDIRESALGLTKRLAQTAKETFGDFEEAVEKDATITAVSDGTVHPLTSYVINYVKFLLDYQSTLKQLLFQEFENEGNSNSQLASVMMRIMQALQTNLEGKSKKYRDAALTNLFLMNNIHYMARSVRRSEAKDLLGDDWVQRHRRIAQQHANQYKRIAWAKILHCLTIQGLASFGGSSVGVDGGGSGSGVSRALVKDRLKIFNTLFEELHRRQSQWTVPDTELRESLKLSVAEVLLPAYKSFIKRFGPLVEICKNPQKYIRYTAEDLDRMLGEFFEGKTLNEGRR